MFIFRYRFTNRIFFPKATSTTFYFINGFFFLSKLLFQELFLIYATPNKYLSYDMSKFVCGVKITLLMKKNTILLVANFHLCWINYPKFFEKQHIHLTFISIYLYQHYRYDICSLACFFFFTKNNLNYKIF